MDINNYKELLFAIFNTEKGKTQKYGVICVYDTKDNEKLIAIFNSSAACANFFKTNIVPNKMWIKIIVKNVKKLNNPTLLDT